MRGAISAQAWSRLQSYASRVRSLTLTSSTRVHSTLWPFLARQCAGAPLLPHLRVLDAFFIMDLQVASLVLLLCPSLREVSVMFAEGPPGVDELSDVLGSVLQNLALIAPRLKKLSLLGNHSLHREHLFHLERFTSVRDIHLSHEFHLDGDVLQTLSKIPTIRHLNVAVRLRKGDKKEELDFGDRFHGLCNLELRGKHKDVADVFIAISAPRLDLLTLQFTNSLRVNALDSPFSAIVSHVPSTITHYSSAFCAALDPLPKSLIDLLHPLPSLLPKLVSFDLTSEKSPLSVTNHDLARLGDAWPHLEHLNVSHSMGRFNLKDVRRPDVWGLAALAQRCSELGMISLPELGVGKPSGPSSTDAEPQRKTIPFLEHRLRELLFQSITVSSTKAQHETAVAIDMVFPYLDLKKMRPGDRGTTRSGPWVNIWKTLEIMRWGRRNRALPEGGCDSAVPEVPEMPGDGADRRHRPAGLHQAHQVPPRSSSC